MHQGSFICYLLFAVVVVVVAFVADYAQAGSTSTCKNLAVSRQQQRGQRYGVRFALRCWHSHLFRPVLE
jgi:hypothetical protein